MLQELACIYCGQRLDSTPLPVEELYACPNCGRPIDRPKPFSRPLMFVVGLALAVALGVILATQLKLAAPSSPGQALPASGAVVAPPAPIALTDPATAQLRQVGLAMINYSMETREGRFLPKGEGSWRVRLGQVTGFYEPDQLRDAEGETRLLLVTGPGTFFDPGRSAAGTTRLLEKCPRAASTIPLIIQVGEDRAVPLEMDQDFEFDPANPKDALGSIDGSFLVLMADGSTRQLPASISADAMTVLCQVEPELSTARLQAATPELQRLGLPSSFARPPKQSME